MNYQSELVKCKLIKRYKRFLADVTLPNGDMMTVHCANSGSMKTCVGEGWDCYISDSNNPKRKLSHTLELVHNGLSFIGVNTSMANKIVMEALLAGKIPELAKYNQFRAEVPYSEKSRIDILATNDKDEKCYIEIKSVSMVRDKNYAFPDAVTKRGLKHLNDLLAMTEEGHRAIIFYLLMRNDGNIFEPAAEIDPDYAQRLSEVTNLGVEKLVYNTIISEKEIIIGKRL